MGLGFTQDNRLINITTPLGKDVLLLSSITGVEGLSQLFHFTVEMVAENSENVKFEDLLGQPATIEILLHDGGSRYINGIINKVIRKERGLTFTGFTADIVPKLWLLTKASQSRIFQHQNVPDILKKVLSDHGIDLANEIQGTFALSYAKRGFNTKIVPGIDKSFIESACVSCGACVSACPTKPQKIVWSEPSAPRSESVRPLRKRTIASATCTWMRIGSPRRRPSSSADETVH